MVIIVGHNKVCETTKNIIESNKVICFKNLAEWIAQSNYWKLNTTKNVVDLWQK